ncbi:hypothetical protein KKC17_03510 [Patescibacteria group bacterium]|nr:hypothetical protein [Patescibacteria group bacterium]
MSKTISAIFLFLALSLLPNLAQAQTNQNCSQVKAYFFWQEGCPHCTKAKPFLLSLQKQYPQLIVDSHEISKNFDNYRLMKRLTDNLAIEVNGVPFTVIGQNYLIGWYDESSSGGQLDWFVKSALNKPCFDAALTSVNQQPTDAKTKDQFFEQKTVSNTEVLPNDDNKSFNINLPLLGVTNLAKFSLPVLTVIIGALDGFNPCAMWVLVFLIGLLLNMPNHKRMWLLGSTFIVSSAAVYFIFMAAWLNLLLFVGFLFWVRFIIGLIALGGGAYNLKEYFSNKEGACKVVGTEKRNKYFTRLKNITQQSSLLWALAGIIILAASVNLVELVCSAGLPAVYSQILALSHLATWQYYLYLLLYVFVFMLDDLLIFIIAMITLRLTGLTTKYTRWSHLIGGVLMLIIGLLLIFKPAWLMFG